MIIVYWQVTQLADKNKPHIVFCPPVVRPATKRDQEAFIIIEPFHLHFIYFHYFNELIFLFY